MENITELVRCRRSVRTFDGKEINKDDRKKLALFMEKIENPYGIPVSFKFLDGKKESLPCPVVSGTDLYVGAKVPHMPHMSIQNILHRICSRSKNIIKNRRIFQ